MRSGLETGAALLVMMTNNMQTTIANKRGEGA
jgi:hypothetical protein